MRQIVAAAGVDAALIVRYFGSKDGLLRKSIADSFVMDPGLLAGPREELGRTLARYVVMKDPASTDFDPVLILLRAAGNERTAALLRESFDQQLVEPLAAWLGGERALSRAGLIVAELFGVVFSRFILGSQPMVAADPETLIDLVGATLQALIDDPAEDTGSTGSSRWRT